MNGDLIKGQGKGPGWGDSLLMALVLALAALAHTYPLAEYLGLAIPYGYHPTPGYELAPLMPGDHLQFLYWCWLVGDNIFGPSAWLTNPYEFNTYLSAGLPAYANFPFSILFVILSPLGMVGAYNTLVILSYVLSGVFAYALAAEVLEDRAPAVLTGLVFALLPFRAAQVLSGHLFGFVAFLLPLALWCLERGIKKKSWAWGAGAGSSLLAMAWMEGHLIYFSALLLGLYLPLRLLLLSKQKESREQSMHSASPLTVLSVLFSAGGLGLGAHLAVIHRTGGAFLSPGLAQALGLYVLGLSALWILLSHLTRALTTLSLEEARRTLARGMLPLAAATLYGLQLWVDLPHLGKTLGLAILAACAWLTLPPLWNARQIPQFPSGWWRPTLPLVIGMAASVGRMLYVKAQIFDPSIAAKGRSLAEVKLFTPHLADLIHPDNPHLEALIYPGVLLGGLALCGLWLLACKRNGQAGTAALWAGLGGLFTMLALGPTLDAAPLYRFLYRTLPFFNMPRVPGRYIMVAALLLGLLASWTLKQFPLSRRLTKSGSVVLAVLLVLAVLVDLWPPRTTGLCLVPPPDRFQAEVASSLALVQDRRKQKRLLCLPIWPGDSHQSSRYELTISRTRAPMLNGYSPVVPRAYLKEIYRPLGNLNLGVVSPEALACLAKNNVDLVAFFDEAWVYPRKVSPFPPALARERISASGVFDLLLREGNRFLWRRLPSAQPVEGLEEIVSPVTLVWDAPALKRTTGSLAEDPQASGWGLLFRESAGPGEPLGPRRPRAQGNMARARAGQDEPGLLSAGPFTPLPPGRYMARFRLRRGTGGPPGLVEVTTDQGRQVLAQRSLDKGVLPASVGWQDVELPFTLSRVRVVEFRTFFNGNCDLELDRVLVSFAGSGGQKSFEASRLFRQTGDLVEDQGLDSGLAVEARAGYHPNLYLMHGPQTTLEPGKYLARFKLAETGPLPPGAPLVHLAVARDLGALTLGHKKVFTTGKGKGYEEIDVPFAMTRRGEVGLRARFLGGGDLRLAGVAIMKQD